MGHQFVSSHTWAVTKRSFLFQKQAASFPSECGIQESVNRLTSQTKRWPFLSPLQESLVGRVSENHVLLRRVVPFVNNSFAPVFSGAFRVRDGTTVLEGHFAISLYTRTFMAFWFGSAS